MMLADQLQEAAKAKTWKELEASGVARCCAGGRKQCSRRATEKGTGFSSTRLTWCKKHAALLNKKPKGSEYVG